MSDPTASRSSVLMVLLGGFAVVVFLVFMTMITGGFFGYIIGFGIFLAIVATFHWLVWGALLTEVVRSEKHEEKLLERASEPSDPSDDRITNRPARG